MRWTSFLCAAGLAATTAQCAAPPPPAPARAEGALRVAPGDAEVWGWELAVRGASEDGAALVACRAGDARAEVRGAAWSARVRVAAGPQEIAVTCEDARGRRLRGAARATGMLRDAPTARAAVDARGGALALDATASAPSEGSRAPLAAFTWELDGAAVASGARATIDAPQDDGIHEVRLRVTDARGAVDEARARVEVTRGAARPATRAPGDAPWIDDAVVYGVVPPRFGDPPLRAVTRALPELAALGVTTLWMSPIFATPPHDYGYAVTDAFRVRADYGDEADLARLVSDAHALGLRVLLDFVPNHAPAEHRYAEDARALGAASHYADFFERDARGDFAFYFDWHNLLNLRYENREVARWTTAAARKWLRDAHVDGFRVDAAWGIRERSPWFWDEWTAEVRRIAPDATLIAEAPARDPFWLAHGFDAAYDWSAELGHAAWEHVFDDPASAPARLDEALAPLAGTAAGARALRFLDNNDTGARFVTRHGPLVTRVAAAALFTVPGVPCLFTGDETGAEYEPYGAPGVLPRSDPHGLRAWYARLAAVRRAVPALRSREHARVELAPGKDNARVYAFARGAGEERAIVVLNFSASTARVRPRVDGPRGPRWRDALSARAPRVTRLPDGGGALAVEVDPWGAAVLVPAR